MIIKSNYGQDLFQLNVTEEELAEHVSELMDMYFDVVDLSLTLPATKLTDNICGEDFEIYSDGEEPLLTVNVVSYTEVDVTFEIEEDLYFEDYLVAIGEGDIEVDEEELLADF